MPKYQEIIKRLTQQAEEPRASELPRCCECDGLIKSEYAYYINGEWLCDECIKQYRKKVNADL